MATLEGAGGGTGVDCSVGTIVWVRRRNGSWWPGRILGQDELSASHLMSPRSGTPVKLLGREDASVDWYNLEKSKRVKAFRCGEFDACIERAEASQGVLLKKREKYARREDAILHALELEKQNYGLSAHNLSHRYSAGLELSGHSSSGLELMDDELMGSSKSAISVPQTHSWRVDLLSEEGSGGKQMKWEAENSDSIPSTRGLQGLGLRVAAAKKRVSNPIACENSKPALLSDTTYFDVLHNSGHGDGIEGGPGGGTKNPLPIRWKRIPGDPLEEFLVERCARRHPLVQVLHTWAKLLSPEPLLADHVLASAFPGQDEKEHVGTVCHAKSSNCMPLRADISDCLDRTEYSFDQAQMSPAQVGYNGETLQSSSLAGEETSSGLVKGDETSSSAKTFVGADMEDDGTLLQGYGSLLSESRSSEQPGDVDSTLSDGFGPSVSGSAAPLTPGVSRWHMKGKRNIRNFLKRPEPAMSPESCPDFLSELVYEKANVQSIFKPGRERASAQDFYRRQLARAYEDDDGDDGDDGDDDDDDDDDDDYDGTLLSGWKADGPPPPVAVRMEPSLVNVELKVQARSYQGERVPLVSLMSRLNGKAIVGHPVHIQKLEDGSTDSLLPGGADRADTNADAVGPHGWRTARRTVMQRVRRPNLLPMAAPMVEEAGLEEPYAVTRHRPGLAERIHRKLSRKRSLLAPKVRMLSSIAAERRRRSGGGAATGHRGRKRGEALARLIKAGGEVPTVTCVPMKVVFSRLLEAVGRPPPPTGMA
ncbi:unnamed protein product [Spirodela intermedia]|uniref:PWWP domain-containing protein n=1 Tax=Spirodela intermedia TaxID=51605 RepID=A0A7I8KCJ6_SPIIN|nr:unnamed protein product [Spirodela intermedia]